MRGERLKKMNGIYKQEVTAAGGIFFPLVVETIGLQSPNSLKVLKSIALKASSLSGIPCRQAINNLLQQLSVRFGHSVYECYMPE